MADQENCVRVTRAAAKKRAADSAGITDERVTNKKRVVLGELSNLSNVVVSVNKVQGTETQKQQPKGKVKTKTRVVKPALKEKKDEAEDEKTVIIDAKSDDSQMCGHYISDIYEYLHQMEVFLSRSLSVYHELIKI